ncbi:outer membrane protein [Bradyrhizobium japonicum]
MGNTFIGAPVNQTVNQLIGGTADLNVPLPQVQLNGFLGGVQAGYNFQSGVMVYGVESDFLWSGIKGRTGCFVVLNCTNDTKWIADITGRVGVTVGDRGLVYIKGGAAWPIPASASTSPLPLHRTWGLALLLTVLPMAERPRTYLAAHWVRASSMPSCPAGQPKLSMTTSISAGKT